MDAVGFCAHVGRSQGAQNKATSLTFCLMSLFYLNLPFLRRSRFFFLVVYETETGLSNGHMLIDVSITGAS